MVILPLFDCIGGEDNFMRAGQWISAAVAAVLLLGTISCAKEETLYPAYTNPEEAAAIRENMRYIIHAAGRLTGVDKEGTTRTYDGANALEGLKQCADAGETIIELDFNFTSDGYLACIHDWYTEYADEITNNVPLTLDAFLDCEIYGNFTPIWLGDVAEYLRANEDVYIVTDIKDKNVEGAAAIAEYCPDLKNRFIIQIYDASEYDAVRELGFEYIVYTLYRLDWASKTDTKALAVFAEKHPLIGYTFSYELCQVEDYVEGMKKSGVPLFIHTVNDPSEQQSYFDMGIDGIYTDMTGNNA